MMKPSLEGLLRSVSTDELVITAVGVMEITDEG